MILILVLLSVILSNRVNAAHANDVTEEEARTYFGEYCGLLQKGQIDAYWEHVQRSIASNPEICDFEKALTKLQTNFVDCWQDVYGRMQWVTDPQKQIVDPINNLCKADKDFTLLPCFSMPVRPEDGQFLLKKFQDCRTYYILSAVASYLYCAPGDTSTLCKGQMFFQEKESFMEFCALYAVSKLNETGSETSLFIAASKEVLMRMTYAWYTHLNQSENFTISGYLSSQGQYPMYAWLAALEKEQILIHMPYMQKGVEAACREQEKRGSDCGIFSYFTNSLEGAQRLAAVLALWPKNAKKENAFVKDIAAAMKKQMRGTHGNLKEMLKIIWAYYDGMRCRLCPKRLLPESVKSFLEGLQFKVLSCPPVVNESGQQAEQDILKKCNQWREQYFLKGLEPIIRASQTIIPLEIMTQERRRAFSQEFRLRLPTATDIFTIFECIQSVQASPTGSVWETCAAAQLSASWLYADDKIKGLVSRWKKRDLRKVPVRCALWDIRQPFIGWNHSEKVLIVCLPQKNKIAPFIEEMSAIQNCPILQREQCEGVISVLCRQNVLHARW